MTNKIVYSVFCSIVKYMKCLKGIKIMVLPG